MRYEFEYAGMITYTGNHVVEDISDCTLKLLGAYGKVWYLSTSTKLGETSIYFLGPVVLNDDNIIMLPGFIFKYDKMSYNEKKIIAKIDKYLNNGEVSEIQDIEKEELLEIMEELKNVKCC